MKKKLAAILFVAIFILTTFPAAGAEMIVASISSGTDYSSGKPSDEGDTLQFFDKYTGINAEVNKQVLDDAAYDSLRDYYNDFSLSKQELFKRFADLKNSYINALQTLYNTNYMDPDEKNTETAMQLYYEGAQTLYGVENCNVYLYNIIQFDGLSRSESVHLDMVVPDKKDNTVITIKFTIPKNRLDEAVSGTIGSMLSSFAFVGLPVQSEAPLVLSDRKIIDKSQLGVYPADTQKNPEYEQYTDHDGGFAISIPSTYVPYIQNNLGGVFTYTSFKINPNIILSISSEPLQGSGMSDALMRFKVTSYGTVNIHQNITKTYGGREYSYLSYDSGSGGVRKYYHDYYMKSGARLFKLQLQSALAEPGSVVLGQMSKILANFDPNSENGSIVPDTGASSDSLAQNDKSVYLKYLNSEEGYSFKYPKNWRLEEVSTDIAYDRLRLVIPGLSGALDVSVQEGELKQIVSFTDIVKSVNGTAVTCWPSLSLNYEPPFKGKASKLLYSDFSINGSISTIYRLSVFIDDNGRNRLCYSTDIIKGRKVYSMFITAGEYNTVSGRFSNEAANDMLNIIAASFQLETTPESEARRLDGETRNRKLVFTEDYLKQTIDPKLTITSVDELQPDGTFYVTAGDCNESGFYRIALDYPNRRVKVIESTLKQTILESEFSHLKDLYSGKVIVSAVKNESNMTMTLVTRENALTEKVTRTYMVKAYTAGDQVVWETNRLARQEDYMWECENYIKSFTSAYAKVYYPGTSVFKDMEPFKLKGMDYRFMVYVTSEKKPGFLVLAMDPRSSILKTEGDFIKLDVVVDKIRTEYGIKYLSHKPGAISFNPETFVLTLHTADKDGSDTLIENYKITYNLDKDILEYKMLN